MRKIWAILILVTLACGLAMPYTSLADSSQSITVTATGTDVAGCAQKESITTGHDSVASQNIGDSGLKRAFQSFTALDTYSLNAISLAIYTVWFPTILTVEIYNEVGGFPSGAAIGSGSYDVSGIPPTWVGPPPFAPTWITVALTSTPIVLGNNYDIVLTINDVWANVVRWATTTTDGPGLNGFSDDGGATWQYDPWTLQDGLYKLWDCAYPDAPTALHITDITESTVTLAWQETGSADEYRLTYKLTGYPSAPMDDTLVYQGEITSATAVDLTPGATHYFGLWAYESGVYSLTATYCVATTSAGYAPPTYEPDVDDDTDTTIMANSPIGGFIDFMTQYGALPEKTVSILGFGAILMFVLAGVAVYTKSVAMTVVCGAAGLILGGSLGIFAFVFLVIALIGGLAIGTLRGGQPSGG